jgi:hypothetical protein
MQGRNSYAIKIRAQQQKQEPFAFSEFEVQNKFTREPQRKHAELKFQPVKVGRQPVSERNKQVQSDIAKVESFGRHDKEQPQCEFSRSVFEVEGEQQAADRS